MTEKIELVRFVKVKYFKETDTALLEFSDHRVHETKEVNENIYIDLDKDGNLVGMTIEHAKNRLISQSFHLSKLNKVLPEFVQRGRKHTTN